MDKKKIYLIVGGVLVVVSFIPILPDPYYHKERVNFWVWCWREIDELLHGEAENRLPIERPEASMPQTQYAASLFGRPSA